MVMMITVVYFHLGNERIVTISIPNVSMRDNAS